MRAGSLLLLLSGLQLSTAIPSRAASFEVSPANVEMRSPEATKNITVKNEADGPLNAQIRVFRWSVVDGKEKLEPATDLVASPPMARVAAKSEQTIRLVRISKMPVVAEENYRILLDEIPDPARLKTSQISMVLRYSVPVFVMPSTPADPQVTWSVAQSGNETIVSATNSGGRRLKVSSLSLKDSRGVSVSVGEGLNGYVLARSSMRWVLPAKATKLSLSGPVAVSARGESGPINAQASSTSAP